MTSAVLLRSVRKRFGRLEALRGLDLTVPRGSLFGLIGPNGAGKTTAFSVICGFLRPDGGEISLLGGGGFDAKRLRGRLSAMPQDAALGRETRCRAQLAYFARLQGMDAPGARAAADRALDAVGLIDRAGSRTRTLSHGMLRRLAVAQALLGAPEVVLLDEPTSGLDPRHAHELRELLRATRKSSGSCTVVISSHNLPELESLCDEVAFIDRGQVVAAGATDVVTGKGLEVEIVLGAGPEPIPAVQAALAEDGVRWDAAARTLRIRFRPRPGREMEDVIGTALRTLLDEGTRVSEVRRGTSLEKKFLELV